MDSVQELPLGIETVAGMLRNGGYATGMFGKWHVGEKGPYHPSARGFTEAVTATANHYKFTTSPPMPVPDGAYQSDFITDLSIDFIRRNRARPFFLYLPLSAPHEPWQAPKADVDYFKGKLKGKPGPNPTYAAMIRALDRNVGRVRNALADSGIADNTVFIFLSDNGGVGGYQKEGIVAREVTSNAPLRGGKGMLYEGGIRVPLIVDWPGVTNPDSVCHTPCHVVDLFPTLAEITGANLPYQPIDGRSIVPELLNPNVRRTLRPIFQHFPGYLGAERNGHFRATPAGAIEYGGWKLLEYFEDNRRELYFLDEDIAESNDLASERPDIANDLLNRLRSWRSSTGARMPIPNTAYRP